jgi:hypothetical protein
MNMQKALAPTSSHLYLCQALLTSRRNSMGNRPLVRVPPDSWRPKATLTTIHYREIKRGIIIFRRFLIGWPIEESVLFLSGFIVVVHHRRVSLLPGDTYQYMFEEF